MGKNSTWLTLGSLFSNIFKKFVVLLYYVLLFNIGVG